MFRYLHILSLFGRNLSFSGVGGLSFMNVENLYFSCMVAIVVTNVCNLEHSFDRNMQESCKNAPKMFKYLQYDILLGKLLGGTCIAFLPMQFQITIYTL